MLSKIRQKKQEGFTIIEVLIVLAIAGLILLVVFLAVPALQRNARNTSRQNDVAAILGGMSEYVNNNNGRLPDQFGGSESELIIGGSGSNTVTVNLGFYSASEVHHATSNPSNTEANDSNVYIVVGTSCGSVSGQENQAVTGPSRAYVARYQLEVDSNQCRAS